MREPARDIPRIEHMLEAIDNALEYTQNFESQQAFVSNKAMLHATIYNIQIVGEAVNRLTKEFKAKYGQIPWSQIEKMRHILVHDYYKVNFDFIWLVVKEDLIPLKESLLKIIAQELENSEE